MSLEVKPIRSLIDLKRVHDIQKVVWGYQDAMIIPYTHLVTVQHNGGTVLGAYVDNELVGFVYGYLGMSGGALYLFSQRMGVLPDYQSLGIGTKLKLAQREHMLRRGIDLIIWTYDPLLGPNAALNIEKLGGFVRAYVRDIYGSGIKNPLQAGLALDRFLLEWPLMSNRVREHILDNYHPPTIKDWLDNRTYHLVNQVNRNEAEPDLPHPMEIDLDLTEETLLVQVPADLHTIRRDDLALAKKWRDTTRTIFESYFRRGYVVTGFASGRAMNMLNMYKMEKISFPSPIDYFSWAKGLDDPGIADE